MENNTPSKNIHPLVAGAAISVMLASLTGVAALTGLIPNSHSTTTPATNAATQPAAMPATANALAAAAPATAMPSSTAGASDTATSKSAPEPQPQSDAPRTAKTTPSQPRHSYAATVAQAPAICSSCGRVESVQAIQHAAKPSGVGVVAGAVLGGVLGNQVGGGNGRTLATVAGAVGGGYAGNEVEKRSRTTTSYQVRVRMEDGSIRTFPYAQQPGWNAGDRVRVVNGHLRARA